MADTFKFSLYEIFGYLLPGAVAGCAVGLGDSLLFHGGALPPSNWLTSKSGVAVEVAFAYLCGHAVQVLANTLLPNSNSQVLKRDKYGSTRRLLVEVRKRKGWCDPSDSDQDILMKCDSYLVAKGPGSEREIYVYREGYYRGTSIALAALACLGSFIVGLPQNRYILLQWHSSRSEVAICSVILLALAVGMYLRSLRFANYRISLSLAFALLTNSKDKSDELLDSEGDNEGGDEKIDDQIDHSDKDKNCADSQEEGE